MCCKVVWKGNNVSGAVCSRERAESLLEISIVLEETYHMEKRAVRQIPKGHENFCISWFASCGINRLRF